MATEMTTKSTGPSSLEGYNIHQCEENFKIYTDIYAKLRFY